MAAEREGNDALFLQVQLHANHRAGTDQAAERGKAAATNEERAGAAHAFAGGDRGGEGRRQGVNGADFFNALELDEKIIRQHVEAMPEEVWFFGEKNAAEIYMERARLAATGAELAKICIWTTWAERKRTEATEQ